jgi:hypothetical protein
MIGKGIVGDELYIIYVLMKCQREQQHCIVSILSQVVSTFKGTAPSVFSH